MTDLVGHSVSIFLESKDYSTGVRHDQKDPLRLGPTSFGPIPELPSQVEGLLTVVSTVKKLHFKNVGFELQKIDLGWIFLLIFYANIEGSSYQKKICTLRSCKNMEANIYLMKPDTLNQ